MLPLHHKDISELKKEILERQLEAAPFTTKRHKPRPTSLKIFDFDSTLFLSPLLSQNLWHPTLIPIILQENLLGPGWWRDYRSLELGPFSELQKTAWEGFWNENIVAEARIAIQDPNVMAVLLTGRRLHPFYRIIHPILESKGLFFDLIGLRPDPEQAPPEHVLLYNGISNVFESTIHFKSSFIINLLASVPSLTHITMWDDRLSHVRVFKNYIDQLVQLGTLVKGEIIHVKAVRPKYNPTWEHAIVNNIMSTHNEAVQHYNEEGSVHEHEDIWDTYSIVHQGRMATWRDQYKLVPLKTSCIVRFLPKVTETLAQHFGSIYQKERALLQQKTSKWEIVHGEDTIYFGTHVLLGASSINGTVVGDGSTQVHVQLVECSQICFEGRMVLRVRIKKVEEEDYGIGTFLLPLWYKPSTYASLSSTVYTWNPLPCEDQLILTGVLDYEHMLGFQVLPTEDS
ncbi:hypothetical protein BDF14DRAFT_1780517 [Spinellus fusiger]|nr:hypothetical protein BDF14DRAFT_1780517 [Spinellus fusiger]